MSLMRRGFVSATEAKPEPAKPAPAKAAPEERQTERITPVIHSDIRPDADAAAFATLASASRGHLKKRRVMTTFRMDESARERMAAFAEAQGVSLSDLLRDLTERFASRLPKTPR